MDIERLKELKAEFEDDRKYNDMRCMSTVTEDDVLELIDDAIARQSVASDEVQRAIELLRQPSKSMDYFWLDAQMYDALNLAITALQAYQPWVPVSEGKRTTQWYQYMCELIEAIESAYQGKEQQEN